MSKHTTPLPNAPTKLPPVATRKAAAKVAGWLGCSGAHKIGQGWHPCGTPEELMVLIKKGSAGLRELQGQKKKSARTIIRRNRVVDTYVSPLHAPKKRTRRTNLQRDGWEPLTERGILGIHTLPSGGLASLKDEPTLHEMLRYDKTTIPVVVELGEPAPNTEEFGRLLSRREATNCEESLIAAGRYAA